MLADDPQSQVSKLEAPQLKSFPRRAWWLVGAASLFLVLSIVAFRQAPRGGSFNSPPSFPDLEWWCTPVEQNAFKRLPTIRALLMEVAAAPDGRIWAVGAGGLDRRVR